MALDLEKQQKTMILVLLSGTILVILNATLLSPALPSIMADTGVSATTVQWLTSSYALVEACVIPLNAFFVGRFSTRQLFMGSIGWFCLSSIVAGLAPNFYVILAARIMMAFATGIIMPMSFSLILIMIPREKRGSAMGLIGLAIGFAPAIGPTLSGFIVDALGWRELFFIVAALCVIVFIAAALKLQNFQGFEQTSFDAASVVMLGVGMVSLLYGISSITSAANIALDAALIIAGLVLLVIFCRRQLKLENPVLRINVMKTTRFRTAVILVALLEASLVGSEVVLPIYVQQIMGNSATVSGLLMMPGAVIGAVCGLVAGRLFDRFGVRGPVVFGSCMIVIGGFGITTFGIDMEIIMVTAAYTTVSIGIQFLMTPLNTWGMNSLDNRVIQHANSISSTMNQVGASVGTAFIVSLTALGTFFAPADATEQIVTMTGVHTAFCGMFGILVLVAVCILFFVHDKKTQKSSAGIAIDTQSAQQHAATGAHTGSSNNTTIGNDATSGSAPFVALPPLNGVAGVDRSFLVCDVMNPHPNTVTQNATVREAIDAMRATETSGVPVINSKGGVVGFISDGDIMGYLSNQTGSYSDGTNYFALVEDQDLWARLSSLLELNVMRLANKRVVNIDALDEAERAFKLLSEKRIKKVPVLYQEKLVGTLSRRNVMNSLATAEALLAEHSAMRANSEPKAETNSKEANSEESL